MPIILSEKTKAAMAHARKDPMDMNMSLRSSLTCSMKGITLPGLLASAAIVFSKSGISDF
jgi:hypothetical protein